ncbi:AAA family ATPase [Catellatospora methionotrophica]|uniref:AAA family ATPase n=1 Tax=Catellatospora methionotrophica TaxID=121620 RepID=UPI00140D5DA8|nr:AAA family ATPase [Catellatospora methionotrophica]
MTGPRSMRLTKVHVHGFRRLVDTSVNVDAKLIAFLGPNEAGKTSFLEALTTIADPSEIADSDLPRQLAGRPRSPKVLTVTFILDSKDRELLRQAFLAPEPGTRISYTKIVSGKRTLSSVPTIQRDFAALAEMFELIMIEVRSWERDRPEQVAHLHDVLRRLNSVLAPLRHGAEPERARLGELSLDDLIQRENKIAEQLKSLAAYRRLRSVLGKSVFDTYRDILSQREPSFELLNSSTSVLKTEYNLDKYSDADLPVALANVLSIGGLSVTRLRRTAKAGDITTMHTMLKNANKKLREVFEPTWRQSNLTLRLEVSGSRVLVLVDELHEDGSRTAIEERSAGLRTYFSMATQLLAKRAKEDSSDSPQTILLIDEAESHLHYDAQADLVSILAKQQFAQQVLYTTHSPGCLPSDLGTGVRFVIPSADDPRSSELRNHFWGSTSVGFSPLLVAMGAGAAAFSSCRRAVLAEGATDMLLLPTLIRRALDADSLPYQVAPGLSSLGRSGLGLKELAAQVAYLVDGDQGGEALQKLLIERSVDPASIVALPKGSAVEDLIDPRFYVSAAETVIRETVGSEVKLEVNFDDDGMIVDKVKLACERLGLPIPGKVAVACSILNSSNRVELATEAKAVLADIHKKFCVVLDC